MRLPCEGTSMPSASSSTWTSGGMAATRPRRAPAITVSKRSSSCARRAAVEGVGELVDVIDAGDKVVVIMQPPSGEGGQATLSANLATFRDGKVIEMVHYPNPEDALAAAGL